METKKFPFMLFTMVEGLFILRTNALSEGTLAEINADGKIHVKDRGNCKTGYSL